VEAYRANQNWQDLNRFTGSVTAKYSPFSWLSHRITIGTDYTQQWDVSYTPYITNDTIAFFYGTGFDGSRSEGLASTFFNTYDYSGSANFNLKPNLLSKTSFGVQYYTNYSTNLNASGTHFPTPGCRPSPQRRSKERRRPAAHATTRSGSTGNRKPRGAIACSSPAPCAWTTTARSAVK